MDDYVLMSIVGLIFYYFQNSIVETCETVGLLLKRICFNNEKVDVHLSKDNFFVAIGALYNTYSLPLYNYSLERIIFFFYYLHFINIRLSSTRVRASSRSFLSARASESAPT